MFYLFLFEKGKLYISSVCWAILVMFKPFFIIILLPLIYHQKKQLFIIAGIGLILMIVPFLFTGGVYRFELWVQWFESVIHHNDYQVNHDSISSLVSYYLGFKNEWFPTLVLLILLVLLLIYDQIGRASCRERV